jgi:hypothetical protein
MACRAHFLRVSARIGALIVQVAVARGVDLQRLMAGAGFDLRWLVDAEARMPQAVEERLWDRAAELTADPLFGLHAAAAIRPGAFDVLDYAVRTAPDLRTALQRLARYNRLVHDLATFEVLPAGPAVRIEHRFEGSGVRPRRQAAEFTLASLVVVASQIGGRPVQALAVEFAHAAPGLSDKRQVQQVHDRLAARWEQDPLGVKPRHTWEEAVLRWLLETPHKATHADDKAELRWLDTHLGGKHLDEIDRTLIDKIKFAREKIASSGTTNRYLALVRAILRRACNEWEWIERVRKFKRFRQAEGRVRALTRDEFARLLRELPEQPSRHGGLLDSDRASPSQRQGLGVAVRRPRAQARWGSWQPAQERVSALGAHERYGALGSAQAAWQAPLVRLHVPGATCGQRQNQKPGTRRLSVPASRTSSGTTCGIRSPPGTGRRERPQTSCSARRLETRHCRPLRTRCT